jgi:hypothetical protein
VKKGAIGGGRVRRRRTWYRRRIRNRRILVSVLFLAVVSAICLENAFHQSFVKLAQTFPDPFGKRPTLQELGLVAPHTTKRTVYVSRIPGVYPYSVVPGGLRSVQALKDAMASDKAVARHFAHFNYDRAQLIRLNEAREVYVSYRIRDTVFWTRKRIRLEPGEMLLTDGNITARAKCGNQISDTAKPEVSNEEPEEDVLDQPVALEPIGPSLPLKALIGPPELPSGVPIAPALFGGGFVFPYVPLGMPLPPAKVCPADETLVDGRCHAHKKPVAPEPSSLILLA